MQPIIVLRDNVDRTVGQEAQRSNIAAGKAIAGAVRTTLGPRGMDKMMVSPSGNVVITNDGATILHELSVEHPGAKMVIEVAETQDAEVGDGTTTACILMGAFLENAEAMLAKRIHPTVIANGYQLGMEKAIEVLNELAITTDELDRETLLKVAKTSVTGKSIEAVRDKICEIIVDAVTTVAEHKEDGTIEIDEDNVQIKTMIGDHMDDAELVPGFVLDKTRVEESMPKLVENAKIALLALALENTKTKTSSKIKISESSQMQAFSEQERANIREITDIIEASGANAVFCQKSITDAAQYFLAKKGIFAIQDVPESDMKALAKAVGGTIVNKPADLNEGTLGDASKIEEMPDITVTKISGCKNPKIVSILLKGTSQIFVDELKRAVYDAARVVQDTLEDKTCVIGGGAIDMELFLKIREYAATLSGRQQIAVEAFADAFESIPLTLAENSGYDPIDKIVALKSAHANGNKYAGLNVYTGEIVDMYEEGVFEPMRVKKQAIQSAAESASMLIRVDDMMITQSRPPQY